MTRSLVISLLIVMLLGSCSPRATLSLVSSRERLGRDDGVGFLELGAEMPEGAEYLGTAYSDNKALLAGQGVQKAVAKAARRVGGNVIRPTWSHKPASFWRSDYYGIEGDVLYVENPDSLDYSNIYYLPGRIADFDYRKFEINVGIGGEPYYAGDEFLIGVMDVWYLGPESVTEMVEKCYDIDISATVSLELAYNLNKRWAIVGSFGGDRMKVDYFDPFSGSRTGSETGYMFDVLAGVRYRYVHKPNLSLYSQGQLGVTFHTKSDYWRRNELAMNPLGFQITALGITFGNRLYGFGEFGWGTEYVAIGIFTGARIGIGYKF